MVDEAGDVEFGSRELDPAHESAIDDAGDGWEGVEGLFKVGSEEFGGVDKWEEEGHGRELVCALNACRDLGNVLWEGEFDDFGCYVGDRGVDERGVCRSGENG